MEKRRLGNQGLRVSQLGLGCMGMTYAYGARDDEESIATIHRALELGITLFDTAEVYGPYSNEELLGRALSGRRERALIATKFGFALDGDRVVGLNSHPRHVSEAVNASLKRLGTDYVDMLYQHRVDPSIPIEDVAGAVGDLIRQGKVRFWGLSEAAPDTIKKAHAVQPVSAVQDEYSLWERGVEGALMKTLEELDIGLVAYAPLGRGFLTGQARRAEDYPKGDYRRHDPRYQGENYDSNMRLLAAVEEIAKRAGATPSQISIAWLLRRNERIVAIPGTKRRSFLEENVDAERVEVSEADWALLDKVLSDTLVAGERYESRMLGLTNR